MIPLHTEIKSSICIQNGVSKLSYEQKLLEITIHLNFNTILDTIGPYTKFQIPDLSFVTDRGYDKLQQLTDVMLKITFVSETKYFNFFFLLNFFHYFHQ